MSHRLYRRLLSTRQAAAAFAFALAVTFVGFLPPRSRKATLRRSRELSRTPKEA
jgi:hypothetical protein